MFLDCQRYLSRENTGNDITGIDTEISTDTGEMSTDTEVNNATEANNGTGTSA